MPKKPHKGGGHGPEHGSSDQRRVEQFRRLREQAAIPQYLGLKAIGNLARDQAHPIQINIVFAAFQHEGEIPSGLVSLLEDPSTQVIVKESANGNPETETVINMIASTAFTESPQKRQALGSLGLQQNQTVADWLSETIREFALNDPYETSFLEAIKQRGKFVILEQSGLQTVQQGNEQSEQNLQEGYGSSLNYFREILPQETSEADVLTNYMATLQRSADNINRRESVGFIQALDRKGREVVAQIRQAAASGISQPINIVIPIGAAHISLLEKLQQLSLPGQPLEGVPVVPQFFTSEERTKASPYYQSLKRLIDGGKLEPAASPEDRELLFRAMLEIALEVGFSTTMPENLRSQFPSLYRLNPIQNSDQMQTYSQFIQSLVATFTTEEIAFMFTEQRKQTPLMDSVTNAVRQRLTPLPERRTQYEDIRRMYETLGGNVE